MYRRKRQLLTVKTDQRSKQLKIIRTFRESDKPPARLHKRIQCNGLKRSKRETKKSAGKVQGEWEDGKVRNEGRTKGITRGAE